QAGIAGVHDAALGPGSANFVDGPAMTEAQLGGALEAGRHSVERALASGAQLYIGGDMGIGNSTAAAALACALLSAKPELLAGPGTGLEGQGVRGKAAGIGPARERPSGPLRTGGEALQRPGGFGLAARGGGFGA